MADCRHDRQKDGRGGRERGSPTTTLGQRSAILAKDDRGLDIQSPDLRSMNFELGHGFRQILRTGFRLRQSPRAQQSVDKELLSSRLSASNHRDQKNSSRKKCSDNPKERQLQVPCSNYIKGQQPSEFNAEEALQIGTIMFCSAPRAASELRTMRPW